MRAKGYLNPNQAGAYSIQCLKQNQGITVRINLGKVSINPQKQLNGEWTSPLRERVSHQNHQKSIKLIKVPKLGNITSNFDKF